MRQPAIARLQIGHLCDLLLPQADAVKVLALLANAVECRRMNYDSTAGFTYVPGSPPELSLVNVKPSQIVSALGDPITQPKARKTVPLALPKD